MQQFEEYQKAKRKLMEYFGNPPEHYPISALLDVEWSYDWGNFNLYWKEGGEDYISDVLSVYEGGEYCMFLMDTSFGDSELVIFDKAKEIKNV